MDQGRETVGADGRMLEGPVFLGLKDFVSALALLSDLEHECPSAAQFAVSTLDSTTDYVNPRHPWPITLLLDFVREPRNAALFLQSTRVAVDCARRAAQHAADSDDDSDQMRYPSIANPSPRRPPPGGLYIHAESDDEAALTRKRKGERPRTKTGAETATPRASTPPPRKPGHRLRPSDTDCGAPTAAPLDTD